PAKIFLSYEPEDEAHRKALESHLSALKRSGAVELWHAGKLLGGEDREKAIDEHLASAQIILLLVSADFLGSDAQDREMKRAMARHEAGTARVIPIIVRPCGWKDTPFAKLQALPKDAKPVTKWSNAEEAWLEVVQAIRRAVHE